MNKVKNQDAWKGLKMVTKTTGMRVGVKALETVERKRRNEESKERMVEYYCWDDICRKSWRASYPDPKNPQYLCPHCGSHKTTFKPL